MTGKINKYFTWEEAACNDGTPVPDNLAAAVEDHAESMLNIRCFLNKPVYIHSWYRTPEYNKKVGGEKKSKHMLGIACDFSVEGFTPETLAAILEGMIEFALIQQGGIGVYPTFVHYDSRGTKARWSGK